VTTLGTGQITPRVVALDGKPAIHKLMPLSLTFGHRVVNGGETVRFLVAMIQRLEQSIP